MPKKRDHKKALNKRKVRVAKAKANAREEMWEKLAKDYSNNSEVIPMPTLVDALSTRDLKKVEPVTRGIESILEYFNKYIQQSAENQEVEIDLPEDVISFIIPLDFYIPLPEPYNAMCMTVPDGSISTANCVTIVSDITPVGDSAIKTSYLIPSICMKDFEGITDFKSSLISKVFERSILECNNIIAGFQTIPTRHNHYMHQITEQSCPQNTNVFIFNRKTSKVLVEETVSLNGNVSSEIFQARPLDEMEMNQFKISHVNKTFTDDKIFELVSKYNNATNTRCFGNNEDAVLLADSFSELTLGYLLCEMKIVNGDDYETVLKQYAKLRTTSELITELASNLNLTNTQFRNQSGYNQWYTHCRDLRNDLTHRFMTNNVSPDESLNALHYSGNLISKTCRLLQQRYPMEEFPEFFDKLDMLISASYFVDVLHRGSNPS